jgi:hypothetical protein
MYADDTNIFAKESESLTEIKAVLDITSHALGSQFNREKTIIKPMGDQTFKRTAHTTGNANTRAFPYATILSPDDSVHVLGIWIGSTDRASTRWDQISSHITKIIRQWHAIGASARNRVLLAKALMQSRCYYLLDSNSIPPQKLRKISQTIQQFVRGPNSCMPYSSLASPIPLGGLNCPSLELQAQAYDLKFLSDLISGDQTILWKQWTRKDLTLSTVASKVKVAETELDPLAQAAYLKISRLEPRVKEAIWTGRRYGLFPMTNLPSPSTCLDMPVYKHPYLGSRATDSLWCMAKNHGITTVGHMPAPMMNIDKCENCTKKNIVVQSRLMKASWLHLSIGDVLPPLIATQHEKPTPSIWQPSQTPYDLLKFCTNLYNLLAVPEFTNPNISAALAYPALTWSAPVVMSNRRLNPRHALRPP